MNFSSHFKAPLINFYPFFSFNLFYFFFFYRHLILQTILKVNLANYAVFAKNSIGTAKKSECYLYNLYLNFMINCKNIKVVNNSDKDY